MTREDLLRPIQQVIGAVERQQTIPALSHLLLQENEGGLTFTATDLEIELVANHAMSCEGIESVTIPARKLLEICQSFAKDSRVDIRTADSRVEVSSGRSRFSLSCVPVEDFPYLHDIELDVSLSLQQDEFRGLIDRSSFAMAQQDVRYYLNGLLLEVEADGIRAVATDGHRLALTQLDRESDVEGPRQVIVAAQGGARTPAPAVPGRRGADPVAGQEPHAGGNGGAPVYFQADSTGAFRSTSVCCRSRRGTACGWTAKPCGSR